jgi:hypothetical protein
MRDAAQRVATVLIFSAILSYAGPVACKHGYSEKAPSQPAPAAPVTKAAPPTPLAVKKAELGDGTTWNPQWDRIVETSLPPEMLSTEVPRDVRHFCPRFYQMNETDKRAFWAYFFQALAGAEAGLNPRTNVRHTEPEVAKVDDVTHQMVHSEGCCSSAMKIGSVMAATSTGTKIAIYLHATKEKPSCLRKTTSAVAYTFSAIRSSRSENLSSPAPHTGRRCSLDAPAIASSPSR